MQNPNAWCHQSAFYCEFIDETFRSPAFEFVMNFDFGNCISVIFIWAVFCYANPILLLFNYFRIAETKRSTLENSEMELIK